LAEVLDEEQVAQVLQKVVDEPPEILALLRELFHEGQRARRVAVDDEVAEPEERFLLDRSEQLQDRLHGDLLLGGGGELVESRHGVAVRTPGSTRDQRKG